MKEPTESPQHRALRLHAPELLPRALWHACRHASQSEWDKVQIHIDQADTLAALIGQAGVEP